MVRQFFASMTDGKTRLPVVLKTQVHAELLELVVANLRVEPAAGPVLQAKFGVSY